MRFLGQLDGWSFVTPKKQSIRKPFGCRDSGKGVMNTLSELGGLSLYDPERHVDESKWRK